MYTLDHLGSATTECSIDRCVFIRAKTSDILRLSIMREALLVVN